MARIPTLRLAPGQLDAVTGGRDRLGGFNHVIGDEAANHIETGDDRDDVQGRGGDDTLLTKGGNDIVRAGAGNDWVDGGAGADVIDGEEGNDYLNGGRGDGAADRLAGGAGFDAAFWGVGDGNDRFNGGDGIDLVAVHGATVEQVLAGLSLPEGVQAVVSQSGSSPRITFVDAAGAPASVSGTLTLGTEVLTFAEIEELRFTR